MANYYYHPLGDYAINYLNGDAPANARPHSYSSHGYSKLDWGCGADQPVYSMTDGTITTIACRNSEKQAGLVVIVKTDRHDEHGPIFINYLEMGGVSERIANIIKNDIGIDITPGPGSFGPINASGIPDFTHSDGETFIQRGELIGYTNRHYSSYSALHLDFTYGDGYSHTLGSTDRNTCFNSPSGTPHITDFSKINEAFSINNGEVSVNDNLLWKNGIYVPDKDGANLHYKTTDSLSYLICLQRPVFTSSSSASGQVALSSSGVAFVENMNPDAVNAYFNKLMLDSWIGPYPNSISDVNANDGLRRAVVLCTRELNFTSKGNLPAVAYAKLLRAKMIGESRSGNNMGEWFAALPANQFAEKNVWMNKQLSSSFDLSYAQAVYNNLKRPELYGSWYGSTDDPFYRAIVHACQQIPIYNVTDGEYRRYLLYTPWAFGICYRPDSGIDYSVYATGKPIYNLRGNYIAGYNDYILFRQVNGDMKYYNSKVCG